MVASLENEKTSGLPKNPPRIIKKIAYKPRARYKNIEF